MPSSRGSTQSRDRTHVSCMAGKFFTVEPLEKLKDQEKDIFETLNHEGNACLQVVDVPNNGTHS